jgi:hypothetical protein
MNLSVDVKDSRQSTLDKDLKRLSLAHGLRPGREGEVTKSTLMFLLRDYEKRLIAGTLVYGSVVSYLSALKSMHAQNGIDWTPTRNDFSIVSRLKQVMKNPLIENRIRRQDYAITLLDLEKVCRGLNPNSHDDLLAGALATNLFWSLGRVHELLHAEKFLPGTLGLGSSSFRAGGYTHMAYLGYDLSLLRLFGRWSSDANDTYLRQCPDILAAAMAAKASGRGPVSMPPDATVTPLCGFSWRRPSALGSLGRQANILKRPLGAHKPQRYLRPSPLSRPRVPRKRRSCESGRRG